MDAIWKIKLEDNEDEFDTCPNCGSILISAGNNGVEGFVICSMCMRREFFRLRHRVEALEQAARVIVEGDKRIGTNMPSEWIDALAALLEPVTKPEEER